jgi:FkbM family methyltransferase
MRNTVKNELNQLLKKNSIDCAIQMRSLFDKVTGPQNCALVLFGAGPLGKRTLAGLRQVGIEPLAFADNNSVLWNKQVDGLIVLAPNEAVARFAATAVFVVTVFNGSKPVQQLQDMNCPRVVRFPLLYWKYAEIFLPLGGLDLPQKIHENADDVCKMLDLWADDISRREYLAQIQWRMTLEYDCLPKPLPAGETYFPMDIVDLAKNEVFVDCGAFDGDSVRSFIERSGGSFQKIMAVEPDPANCASLQRYVATLKPEIQARIEVCQYAVGAQREKVRFVATGTAGSGVSQSGTIEADCRTLDELLAETTPTYLKMDIEGAEGAALMGARRTIEKNSAVLAICLYHQQEHLWQLPLLIAKFSSRYKFFLRRYAEECWEVVCYAVPIERCKQ